ncbi:MAG: SLC13 family permease [Proteobacteria bacterium]|nr:SLC13 family permease [Pseudomonadota bacterium]
MTTDQFLVLALVTTLMGLFIWGRWRHDVVALAALVACVLLGLVPGREAFAGFGHPAVITVAAVLVLSAGLEATGAVDWLVDKLVPRRAGFYLTLTALCVIGTVLSAFMNNVGALALLMPAAIQLAKRIKVPPGRLLMPIAFATLFGGMTTLIGTPPNLIVSSFMQQTDGLNGFAMFDFLPVGGAVAVAGVTFMLLIGWRLVPERQSGAAQDFNIGNYLTEVVVAPGSDFAGKRLHQLYDTLREYGAQVVGMVRDDTRLYAPYVSREIVIGDVLTIEAEPEALGKLIADHHLKLAHRKRGERTDEAQQEETRLAEVVVMPASRAVGRRVADMAWRDRFGVEVLAISRQGGRSIRGIIHEPLLAGDVLLLQGAPATTQLLSTEFALAPLTTRRIRIRDKRKMLLTTGIMAGAVAAAALGLLSAAVSFTAGVLLYMLLRVMPLERIYASVDWSVVVLLGALMPVAAAMETTGTAELIARFLMTHFTGGHAVVALTLVLVITMTLSDFMNNAATAAVMCPIALNAAHALDARPESFLMAVAIGGSCAFLTPIGHQNNTLILGPGGFKFSDYWRAGLPLEILVVAVAVPMLLVVWPL